MANRIDSRITANLVTAGVNAFNGGGTNYIVQTPAGVLYAICSDAVSDLVYRKSTDNGLSWSAPVIVFVGTVTSIAVWYDRWSNIAAGLIHIAYTDSGIDDTLYRTINTESADALSTQTTIFAGASTQAAGSLSIVRAVGGNVYCKTMIDQGTEGGFYRLPNANVPSGAWDAARTIDEALAVGDQMILQPDFDAADTQDIMAFFWDASANEISRKLYDDSGNSWSETSIAGSMVEVTVNSAFPNFAAAPDISGTRSVFVAWNGADTANADLKCWTVDSGAITACTDVVTNGTDDQAMCAISIDTVTGYWHVFYFGKSDGSETYPTSLNVYTKVSMDAGATWGPETKVTNQLVSSRNLFTAPLWSTAFGVPPVAYTENTNASYLDLIVNVPIPRRRASHQLYGG